MPLINAECGVLSAELWLGLKVRYTRLRNEVAPLGMTGGVDREEGRSDWGRYAMKCKNGRKIVRFFVGCGRVVRYAPRGCVAILVGMTGWESGYSVSS